jgi:hypothetical protein
MKSREEEVKLAIRFALRKLHSTDAGEPDDVLLRFRVITSTVEFLVGAMKPQELTVAIVETFKEIEAERNALEPIARFCEDSLAEETG